MRKYPFKLFLIGMLTNFIFRYFYLLILGLLLCIVGIWNVICLLIGITVLGLDLTLSLYDQMQIRKTVLSTSDDQEVEKILDAFYNPDSSLDLRDIIDEKMQEDPDYEQRKQALESLVVYRTLRDSVQDNMTLEQLIDTFGQMCQTPVGDPDDLLFEVGTFPFTGEFMFQFSLVRQFQFLNEDEYVQLHLDILYEPGKHTRSLRGCTWAEGSCEDFIATVKSSRAFQVMKDHPIAKVKIFIEDT